MGNLGGNGNVETVAQEVIANDLKNQAELGRDGKATALGGQSATSGSPMTRLQKPRKFPFWAYGGGCLLIVVALLFSSIGLLNHFFGEDFTDDLISGYFHDIGFPVPSEFYVHGQSSVVDTPVVVAPPIVVAPPPVIQPPVVSIYGIWMAKVSDLSYSDNRANEDLVRDYGLSNGLTFSLSTSEGHSIVFQSPMSWWVTVSGELAPDGTFDATGAAKGWGIDGLGAEFKGTFTPSGLSGDYSVGVKVVTETGTAGRVLASGRPITFHVEAQLQGAAAPGAAPVNTQIPNVTSVAVNPPSALPSNMPSGIDPRLQTFMGQFVPALRTNDTVFLFQHLHPAVLNLYGAAQCQSYVNQRPVDTTYNIAVLDVQGPASWEWVASGISTQVQDVYTLDANVTVQGQTAKRQVHFGLVGNSIDWFTECGQPLVTPTPTP